MSNFDKYQSDTNEIRPERIAGWTMVIALHVFVFGLLPLPLGAAEQAKETRHTIQVALLEPKVEPPPPPPPPEIPKQVVIKKNPPAPKPVAKPAPTPPTALIRHAARWICPPTPLHPLLPWTFPRPVPPVASWWPPLPLIRRIRPPPSAPAPPARWCWKSLWVPMACPRTCA